MGESIGVGDSVTVEVTRASGSVSPSGPLESLALPSIPFGEIMIAAGVVVAGLFLFMALRKRRGLHRRYGVHGGGFAHSRLLRSIGIAALFGFVGLVLSGSPISWVLSAAIFYYEFFMRGRNNS
jgi:hypothetical protein